MRSEGDESAIVRRRRGFCCLLNYYRKGKKKNIKKVTNRIKDQLFCIILIFMSVQLTHINCSNNARTSTNGKKKLEKINLYYILVITFNPCRS